MDNNINSIIKNVIVSAETDMTSLPPSEQRAIIMDNINNKDIQKVDLIWSQTHTDCCIAVACGWQYGFRSGDAVCLMGKKQGRHYPVFIDNLYEDYVHQRHLMVVRKYRPKYCTVRDMMTEEQCEDAGIRYYSSDKILEWGYELKQYARNVMLIPKHEKYIKLIDPKDFMIGYSVPSSYGGTPIPITEFGDYKIHLLGGSINKQIALCSQMPDNIVSLDNNSLHLASTKGQFWLRNGVMVSLDSLNVKDRLWSAQDMGFTDLINVQKVAIAISLGNVASYFGRVCK